MSDSAAPHLVDLRDLRLDTAHALVSQVNGSGPATASDYAHPRQYLQGLIDGLCELSLKDPLTGLANRRHFRAVLEREIDRVTRSGEAALLLMLDIDHFKAVNDTHGHPAGDFVLRAIADLLQESVRGEDAVGRIGGEEFALLLPGVHQDEALRRAETIRAAIASSDAGMTVSIGVAGFVPDVQVEPDTLLRRADAALYAAKRGGRNQVAADAG